MHLNRTFAAALFCVCCSATLHAAEAVVLNAANMHLLPHGKEVDAVYGDYLMRSDKIAVTLGGPAAFRDANVNTQCVQGAVLDLVRLDLPGGDNDLLDAYYPQGHYLDAPAPTTAQIVKAAGAEVVVRFTRKATAAMQGDPVDVVTEYTLRDGEPYLRIRTTYTNPKATTAQAAVYDKIRADTLFRIPPAGTTKFLIYDEPWTHAAYGVVRTGGLPLQSYANPANKTYFEEGGNRLDFPDLRSKDAEAKPLSKALPVPTSIAAGASLTIDRVLIPGRHPADVQAVIATLLHQPVRRLPVEVADERGSLLPGVSVVARNSGEVLSEGFTDARGSVILVVPESSQIEIAATERGRADVVLNPGPGTTRVAMGPLAQAVFDVTDATPGAEAHGPAKILIHGVDGTPDPNFGPDALPFQAGSLCFTPNGRAAVALPPGRYEALIGRGPEFSLARRQFSVKSGAVTPVSAEIRRVVDSPGWIVADFHNHTTNSNDSIADPRGRVAGIAANGIEFAPATEHNRISSFDSVIEMEHLESFLKSTGGIELSGRPGPGQINHQNAFPLRIQPGQQSGGAPMTDKDPRVQISRLFNYDQKAEKFVQHNHPDIGWLYFDKDRDGHADGGFGTLPYTNAIELSRDLVLLLPAVEHLAETTKRGRGFGWLQMLNQGDHLYVTGNSDAHVTAFNNGSIFTYVRSAAASPMKIVPIEVAREAKAGHMVVSNGPFLDVRLNDALPGDTLRASGSLKLRVRAQCPEWLDIDRVQVLINGRAEPRLNFTRASHPDAFPAGVGALRFERDIDLTLDHDAHVIVIATGEKSRLGPFNGPYAKQPPTALSNPIFVDVDGNGFQANHDTLGVPLPVASREGGAGPD